MTGTKASQPVRGRPSSRLSKYKLRQGQQSRARSINPTRAAPVTDRPVLTEGPFGGERLLLALDQIQQQGPPRTVAGWKALAEGILVDECCTFHRNREISSCYAWAYMVLPTCFKWAGMAAIASHHVRLALLPLHIETAFRASSGHTHRPEMWRVLTEDVNTLRATNNDIFDDLFWVHLAYITSEDGIRLLRALLGEERHYAPILAGFEAIDEGRRVLEDATASPAARGRAHDRVWKGNLLLLEHEQRAVVQPRFDRLSDVSAQVVSFGSATTFETRGPWQAMEYFTWFYFFTLVRTNRRGRGERVLPRITNYDDRWRWLVSSVVPRFQRFDTDPPVIRAILRRIVEQDRPHAFTPCGTPTRRGRASRGNAWPLVPRHAWPDPGSWSRRIPHP